MRLPGRNFRQAQPGFSVRKPSGWPPAKAFGRSQAVSSVRLPVPPFTPPCGKFVRRRPAAGRASWIQRTWTLSSRCIPFPYGLESTRLRTFPAVAEQLSFTHAAERLFVTPAGGYSSNQSAGRRTRITPFRPNRAANRPYARQHRQDSREASAHGAGFGTCVGQISVLLSSSP